MAAAAGGCRGHLAVCEEASCDSEPEASGGWPPAGAEASDPSGAGGDGGAGGAMCTDDGACDNGLRCDGEERCTASGCEPGEAIACTSGTSCDEHSPEVCVYAERSPWFVLAAVDKLLGLPTALLGKEPLAVLGVRPRIDLWTGFDDCSWSPDGRWFVVRAAEVQLGYSSSYSRVGDGLPTPLRSLPELPNWYASAAGSATFSPDSRYFFASDSDSGGFLFDLQTREPTARPLDTLNLEFCAEPGVWLAEDEVQRLADGELSSRPLPAGGTNVSPDRRLTLVSRVDDDGISSLTLTPCGMDDWTADLPGDYGVFSPDSQLLWVDVAGGSVYSLEEPSAPIELLSSQLSGYEYSSQFSPNGQYVLAERDDVYYLAEVRAGSEQTPVPLQLPELVEPIRLLNEGLLAWSTWFLNAPRDLLWQPIPPGNVPPLVLHHDPTGGDGLLFDEREPHRFLISSDDGSESRLLRVDLSLPEPTAEELIALDSGVVRWVPAPDGSGIAFNVLTGTIAQAAYFARFDASGKLGEPVLLSESGYGISFQPWP